MNAMMSALCLALALCLAVAVQAHPHGGVKELHAQLADPGVFLQQHGRTTDSTSWDGRE